MPRTNIVETWADHQTAAGNGLRSNGTTLYMGSTPIACWLDRADEAGAQIALVGLRIGHSWVMAHINNNVDNRHCVILRVPCPVPTPTPEQHAENLGHLLTPWRSSLAAAAHTVKYALGHYDSAVREARAARLYAWAFDLPEPKPQFVRELTPRAKRNAKLCREGAKKEKRQPSRDMTRALWRAGRGPASILTLPIMLRLSSDRKRIETSDGESVPASDVEVAQLWELACDCRKRRKARIWRIVSERPRIGRWTAQVINSNGSIQVACHTLPFDEIARLVLELRQQ